MSSKKPARYEQYESGQWIEPRQRGFRLACCDCGLVHLVDFRVRRGTIELRFYRDNQATAGRRRRPHPCRPVKPRAKRGAS